MGLLDKIGDVFEDVTDAVVDAAPIVLPIAMQYFFPQMSLVGRQALGAGIGSLIRGDKAETALKAAALGGTLGAIQGGIGSTMSGGTFGEGFGRAFQGTETGTGIMGRPLTKSVPASDRTIEQRFLGVSPPKVSQAGIAFEAPVTGGTGDQVLASLGEAPSGIVSPFSGGPSTADILSSSEFQALTDKGLTADKALSVLQEQYTPTMLQRFGLPLAGITTLAAFSGDDEEEEGGDDFVTGADLYYANPDDYNINLYEEGGVASVVPNKYKGFSKLPEAVQAKISPELAQKYAQGGQAYPRRTGGIGPGEGSGTKDDVPALLMDGEFVMTRDAVKGAGNGNIKKGINRMYDMMRNLENRATA